MPDSEGTYHRRKKSFAAQFVVALDDVTPVVVVGKQKAQIPFNRITLPPTYVLETSEGNFQVGYFLREPIFDRDEAEDLSKAIIAVMVVFYAVGQWNSYFNAMMYLSNKEYYPLQLVLREILLQNRLTDVITSEGQLADSLERQRYAELIKYGVIVVSSVPVLIMYPFAQKYFVKGVFVGSIKG